METLKKSKNASSRLANLTKRYIILTFLFQIAPVIMLTLMFITTLVVAITTPLTHSETIILFMLSIMFGMILFSAITLLAITILIPKIERNTANQYHKLLSEFENNEFDFVTIYTSAYDKTFEQIQSNILYRIFYDIYSLQSSINYTKLSCNVIVSDIVEEYFATRIKPLIENYNKELKRCNKCLKVLTDQ